MAADQVFINCPFDDQFKPLFDAILFAVHDLGFRARHALVDNTDAVRLIRIYKELTRTKYSIHDISRVEVGGKLRLPRFNMPFEAGIAYALHEGSRGASKHHMLLLDSEPYRYQASLSDVAGLDPKIHGRDPKAAIAAVRTFLATKSGNPGLPGGQFISDRYDLFRAKARKAAKATHISVRELKSWSYVNDLQLMMVKWIQDNPS